MLLLLLLLPPALLIMLRVLERYESFIDAPPKQHDTDTAAVIDTVALDESGSVPAPRARPAVEPAAELA